MIPVTMVDLVSGPLASHVEEGQSMGAINAAIDLYEYVPVPFIRLLDMSEVHPLHATKSNKKSRFWIVMQKFFEARLRQLRLFR